MRPPDLPSEWDQCSVTQQAEIIAYDQIRGAESMSGCAFMGKE